MRRTSFVLLGLLIFSMAPNNTQASEDTNFELTILINSGSILRERIGFFLRDTFRPFHIDVHIEYKDFGMWGNDLLHSPGHVPWDLAILGYTGPFDLDGVNAYVSDSFFGCLVHQLCDEDWQEWQLQDTGINQTEVDALLEDILRALSLSLPTAKGLLEEYQQLFMEDFLYEFPLLQLPIYTVTSSDVQDYESQRGILLSILSGMSWKEEANKHIFRMSAGACSRFGNPCNLDPTQATISGQLDIVDPLHTTLMYLDENFNTHPGLAKQWQQSDWILDNGTSIPYANFTYWLYDDIYYIRNTPQGYETTSETVKPEDLVFTLQMSYMVRHGFAAPNVQIHKDQNAFSFYLNGTTTSFLHTDNSYGMTATPTYLLNTTLTYNSTLSADPYQLIDLGLSPFDTDEWDDYELNPVTAGPYALVNSTNNELYTYKLRDDFWYPNEWDIPGSDFAKHLPGTGEILFFGYNATANQSTRKPTTAHIPMLQKKVGPFSTSYQQFLNDEIDIGGNLLTVGGVGLISSIRDDPQLMLHQRLSQGSGEQLIFNLLNTHLKKYEVRRAIAHAIDKAAMNNLFDGLMLPRDTIVFNYLPQFYNDSWKIEYQYSEARDLMRKNNYTADETNEFRPDLNVQELVVSAIPDSPVPIDMMPLLVGVGLLMVIHKKLQLNKQRK